jgi:uncharacterized membrane protein (DUF441 family)
MPALLRVLLGRYIGVLVGAFVTWLAGKGIVVTQENVDFVVTALVGIFGVVYSTIHTLVNARINPKDVSSPTIAAAQAQERRYGSN